MQWVLQHQLVNYQAEIIIMLAVEVVQATVVLEQVVLVVEALEQ
jgi:hypothetical protein